MPSHRIERILGGLLGAVVGDALGVPVEFSRASRVTRCTGWNATVPAV